MQRKLRILISNVTNPWFNLATEDWIFHELEPDCQTLFLWRNTETVVIGHFQNPWVECKTDKMEEDGVYLARRQSGGGAVFHDLGNTNFTFLSPKEDYDQQANFQIIRHALKTLGIDAHLSGRNDMLVGEKKISGSAFKHKNDRCFHHGTLLVNANMSKLSDYLQPHPLKLAAKGIKSVRSRVANLVEFNPNVNHDIICQAIIASFCEYYGQDVAVEILDEAQLSQNPHLNKFYEKMADWHWRFGKTPEFTHQLETRFAWGIIDLRLNIEQAKIKEVTIFSDALDTQFIFALKEALLGQDYNLLTLTEVLQKLAQQNPAWKGYCADFIAFLKTEVKA